MAYCPRCGAQNADSAIFCSRCGSSVAPASAHSGNPTVVVVGSPSQQIPVGSNPGTVWLWLNIVITVLSCCSNILGIIGIIFGAMSVSKFNNGLYAESKSNASVSKWMFIISILLGVIGSIVVVAAGALPLLLAAIQALLSGNFSSVIS